MKRLMAAKLIEFDLPFRTVSMLHNRGIKSLGQLCAMSEADLRAIPQFGITMVKHLREFLASYDLRLAGE